MITFGEIMNEPLKVGDYVTLSKEAAERYEEEINNISTTSFNYKEDYFRQLDAAILHKPFQVRSISIKHKSGSLPVLLIKIAVVGYPTATITRPWTAGDLELCYQKEAADYAQKLIRERRSI